MCKTQCWYYTCGHWSDHRLSTCRGRYSSPHPVSGATCTACSGASNLPPISVSKPCAVCNKDEIIKDWRQSRSKTLSSAIKRGESRQAVYEQFGSIRRNIEASVPREEPFTSWRPQPISTWTPNKPSPLRRMLRVGDDLEEGDEVDVSMTDFEKLEMEMSDGAEMLSLAACSDEEEEQVVEEEKKKKKKEATSQLEKDLAQIDPALLADEDRQMTLVAAVEVS